MIVSVLLLAAATAFAAPAPKTAKEPEETLRVMLLKLHHRRDYEVNQAIVGGADELRDAVKSGTGTNKKRLAARLPGMARDPFDICRDLAGCPEAPLSLHVEDNALIDDAFLALARPWFNLQKARGKAVTLAVDPGTGVRIELEDFPGRAVITLSAEPTPTGGYDVALDEGPESAKAYAAVYAKSIPKK